MFRLLIAAGLAIFFLYRGVEGAIMFAEGLLTHDRLEASVGFLVFGSSLGGLAIAHLVAFYRPSQRAKEDRGPPSPPGGIRERLTSLCMILAGSACVFVAGKAVVSGAIHSLGGKPSVLFSMNPSGFLLLLAFWGGLGILLLAAAFREPRR